MYFGSDAEAPRIVLQLFDAAVASANLCFFGCARLREAARGIDRVAKQDHARPLIARAEDLAPRVLDIFGDRVDEIDLTLLGRRTVDLARCPNRGWRRAVASAEQGKEIRTGSPAQHEQHEKTAEAEGDDAHARASPHVFDVSAIASGPTHALRRAR